MSLTYNRYSQGEDGPEPHIHREHSDCWWILSGTLTFEAAGERVELGAGQFILVPPNVVHTFRNEHEEDAFFLNFHVPDKGFADNLRGTSEGFDSFDPPTDGGRPFSDVVIG
jgi:mannose-6-phosphate isomerase-like protein (cupin superfamily)